MKNIILILILSIISCNSKKENSTTQINNFQKKEIMMVDYDTIQFTNGFDFPVGKPNATGYYNAQKFTENNHLGDDWNGTGGGNTDLGDPIYSIANGYVSFAKNINGGWGNVIRTVHFIDENKQLESLYAHCQDIFVKKGDYVTKGKLIGTIGNNNGQYLAHLHFELRNEVSLPVGGGYSLNTKGYIDPTEFIKNNRK